MQSSSVAGQESMESEPVPIFDSVEARMRLGFVVELLDTADVL